MWKKILAVGGTIAVALGLVTLTVAPAQAHTGDLIVTAVCNAQTGKYDLTAVLKIANTTLNGSTLYKVGTTSFEHTPKQTDPAFPGTPVISTHNPGTITLTTLSLPGSTTGSGPWIYAQTTFTDGYFVGSDGQLTTKLDGTCGDDMNHKITICHATPPQNAKNGWNQITIDYDAIFKSGHDGHAADIIPSFDYVKNGQAGHYPGKNWTAGGQLIYDHDCQLPNAPPAPTYTEATCTAAGQVGTASVTIPSNVPGIRYLINGADAAQGSTTSFAAGTKVTVTVQVTPGYELAYPSLPTFPSHTFTNVSTSCVQAIAPTVTQAVCNGPGTHSTASYTIVAADHVTYRVNGQTVSGTVNVAKLPSTVKVDVVVEKGYTLVGPASFTLDFTDPGACLTPVTASVTFTESQCTTAGASSDATYTIPAGDGVNYTVTVDGAAGDGSVGTHVVAKDAHVIVVATAKAGYELSGQTTFDKTFTDPGSCLQPASVTTRPSFVDAACVAGKPGGETGATYTLFAADHVSYEVSTDGVTFTPKAAGGPYAVAQGTQLTIHAIPDSGYYVTGASSWSHSFTTLGDSCQFPVTPATPNFTPALCYGDRPGHSSASYEIDAVDHVHYLVSLNHGKTWKSAKTGVEVKVDADATVWIKPVADAGYKLTDATVTKHTFTDPGSCFVTVTLIAPTFTDAVCSEVPGQQSQGSYTIPQVDHVLYNVLINGHLHIAVKPGIYSTQPGDKVYVVAIPALGYEFGDGDWFWSHTFADPGQCLVTAIPVDPSITDQVCTVDEETGAGTLTNGEITIPATTGAQYSIDGQDVVAGDHPVAPGDHTVAAVALTGYTLSGYTGPWTLTSRAAEFCGDLVTHPLVTPIVTSTQSTCAAGGSYTLSNDIDVPDAVMWTVNGAPVSAGTFTVSGAATVHIRAVPNSPDYGFAGTPQDQVKEWTLTFSAPADCELKTLALTGTTLPVGWIGAGVLLLVAGLSLMVVQLLRRRRGEV